MATNKSDSAIAQIEKALVNRKREAKDYEARGLAVPAHLTRKIESLKSAAAELRGIKGGVDQ